MGDGDSDSDLAVQRPSKHKKQAAETAVSSGSDLEIERKEKKRREAPVRTKETLVRKVKKPEAESRDLLVEWKLLGDGKKSKKTRQKEAKAKSEGSDLSVERQHPKGGQGQGQGKPAKKDKSEAPSQEASDDSDLAVRRKPKHKGEKPKKQEPSDSEMPVKRPRAGSPRSPRSPPRAKEPSRSRDVSQGMGFGFTASAASGFGDGKGEGKGEYGKGDGKGKGKGKEKGKEEGNDQPKEQPNFEPSGLLALEDNAKNGIPLKFTVPAEARRPATKWRLYVFTKGGNDKPKIIPLHKEVGYLFGKDRRVAEVPTDHPTCSKQHAVLHYRQTKSGQVKPYIMDLESINGTFLNGTRIEHSRYYEMKEKDVLKFGMSSREFVLLHGGSANHMSIDPKDLRSPSEG